MTGNNPADVGCPVALSTSNSCYSLTVWSRAWW